MSSCVSDQSLSGIKGTGYCLGAFSAAVGLLTVSATVIAVALSLLTADSFFIYSIGVQAPIHLIWAIPVTFAFLALDLLFILGILRISAQLSGWLANKAGHYLYQCRHHFQQLTC